MAFPIEFHTPSNIPEALSLLERHGDNARIFAGGTALVVLLKQSLLQAEHLVSLQAIPGLSEIRKEDDSLHIGAFVRHREIETSPLVRQFAPLLAEVYSHVA